MQAYIVRRLLALIPTLFFASLIVFVTVRLIPGDIIDMMLSQNDIAADKFSRDQLIAALGLDKPIWRQYLTWIGNILLSGDFGRSLWQNTPVAELLLARLPVTFQLGAMALLVALIVAIALTFAVLLQSRGSGLGGTFGGDSAVYRSRRGIERRLWQFTIVLIALFVAFSLAAYVLTPAA